MDNCIVGNRVWLQTKKKTALNKKGYDWLQDCVVEAYNGSEVTFATPDGEKIVKKVEEITLDNCLRMSSDSVRGVEDMSALTDMHLEAILRNICVRMREQKIYTFVGSIVIAMNPYKTIEGMYTDEMRNQYANARLGDLPPHAYAISREAYCRLQEKAENQVVLISGESGAGKTETAKILIQHLSMMCGGGVGHILQQIKDSSPLLESLGNAKTVYNNNSSRFGKFIEIQYDTRYQINGARTSDYLLEKSRVTKQNKGERNFHIFYQLVRATPPQLKERFQLGQCEDFHYLNQSGCTGVDTIKDDKHFAEFQQSMTILNMAPQAQTDLLAILAGILHLGNVSFTNKAGAKVADRQALVIVEDLLGVSACALESGLTTKTLIMRGEKVVSNLSVDQAADSRDALAMNLYAGLFKFVVGHINSVMMSGEKQFIGVLDIFGFENFEVNSLEQFCINYANEKLAHYFNNHIFGMEQAEYKLEGIRWDAIDFKDNLPCLELIEARMGVIALLDEESRFQKATPDTLIEKLKQNHNKHSYFSEQRLRKDAFGVVHYAGTVVYDVNSFLDKNRDTFKDDLLEMLQGSTNTLVASLFEAELEEETRNRGRGRKATIAKQFKNSLQDLMSSLSAAAPFFIRCLKPNLTKQPDLFVSDFVHNQLLYSGMLETVRIRRAGYPSRVGFEDFLHRYKTLTTKRIQDSLNAAEQCRALMTAEECGVVGEEWQVGHSKIFMKENLELQLEKKRLERVRKSVETIAWALQGYAIRCRFVRMKSASIVCQAAIRCVLANAQVSRLRTQHNTQLSAAVTLQCAWRCYVARQAIGALVRKEQQRMAEMAIAERQALELARAKKLAAEQGMVKMAQSEAAKRKAEEMAANEQQERERAMEDKENLANQNAENERELVKRSKSKRMSRLHDTVEAQQRRANARMSTNSMRGVDLSEPSKYGDDLVAEMTEGIATGATLQASGVDEGVIPAAEEVLETDPLSYRKTGPLQLLAEGQHQYKKRFFSLRNGRLTHCGMQIKNEFLKSGWMEVRPKNFGGRWSRRWFVVKGHFLFQFNTDAEKNGPTNMYRLAETEIEDLVDNKKMHTFRLTNKEGRTDFACASSEARVTWMKVLEAVNAAKGIGSVDDLDIDTGEQSMHHDGDFIDIRDIVTCGRVIDDTVANSFALITSQSIYQLAAETAGDMEEWISYLQPLKDRSTEREEGLVRLQQVFDEKVMAVSKPRWCVLEGTTFSVYRSRDLTQHVGDVGLNSYCTVAYAAGADQSTLIVGTQDNPLYVRCVTTSDAERWYTAFETALNKCPNAKTSTETIIQNLVNDEANYYPSLEEVFTEFPFLGYTDEPLEEPLLYVPYYAPDGTDLHSAAVELNVLLTDMSVGNAQQCENLQVAIQLVLRYPELRSEAYVQLLRMLINHSEVGSAEHRDLWRSMVVISNAFVPSKKMLKYTRKVLIWLETLDTEDEKFVTKCVAIILHSLPKAKLLISPYASSIREITATRNLEPIAFEITTTDGVAHSIKFTPTTTVAEILDDLTAELGLLKAKRIHTYALYEDCQEYGLKMIDSSSVLASVLAKWESFGRRGIPTGTWAVCMRIQCYAETTEDSPLEKENDLTFYQTHDSFLRGWIPFNELQSLKQAAIYLHYRFGDRPQQFSYEATPALPNGLFSLIPQRVVLGKYGESGLRDAIKAVTQGGMSWSSDELLNSAESLGVASPNSDLASAQSKGLRMTMKKLRGSVANKKETNRDSMGSAHGSDMNSASSGLNAGVGEERKARSGLMRTLKKMTLRKDVHRGQPIKELLFNIDQQWMALSGLSKSESAEIYMAAATRSPAYGCAMFEIEYYSKDTRETMGVTYDQLNMNRNRWLAVSRKGLEIRVRNTAATEISIPYEDIVSTELPERNAFECATTEEVLVFLTHGDEHYEINKLFTAYLSSD